MEDNFEFIRIAGVILICITLYASLVSVYMYWKLQDMDHNAKYGESSFEKSRNKARQLEKQAEAQGSGVNLKQAKRSLICVFLVIILGGIVGPLVLYHTNQPENTKVDAKQGMGDYTTTCTPTETSCIDLKPYYCDNPLNAPLHRKCTTNLYECYPPNSLLGGSCTVHDRGFKTQVEQNGNNQAACAAANGVWERVNVYAPAAVGNENVDEECCQGNTQRFRCKPNPNEKHYHCPPLQIELPCPGSTCQCEVTAWGEWQPCDNACGVGK